MFSKFLFLVPILLLVCSPRAHSNTCSKLFDNQPDSEALAALEAILFNDVLISKIEDIRRKYDGSSYSEKYTETVSLMSLLKDLENLPYEKSKLEFERIILSHGVSNIMQDLVQISPTQLTTRRIITENIAVVYAHLLREAGKNVILEKTENVISLNSQKFANNSGYLAARKNVFDLIDSYRHQEHVASEIKRERVDELMVADTRFISLSEADRTTVVHLIIKEIETLGTEYDGVEFILERYFSSREKQRKRV